MKHLISIFGLIVLLNISNNLSAQLSLSAQLRNRAEARKGYKTLTDKDDITAYFISQRTRMNFGFAKDQLSMRVSIQDVRVWGDEKIASNNGVFGDAASIDLYESWGELSFADKKGSFRVGRQEFNFDGGRLLSNRNWNQNGLTYDAALLKYNYNKLKFYLAGSYNSKEEAVFGNYYYGVSSSKANDIYRMKTMNFFRTEYCISDSLKVNYLAIMTAHQDTTGTKEQYNYKYTTGLSTQLKTSGLFADAEVYYQFGKNWFGDEVSAYMFSVEGGFDNGKYLFAVGADYISGGEQADPAKTDKTKAFDVLYGAQSKFYGRMDYISLSRHTNYAGFADLYAEIDFKFLEKNDILFEYHYIAVPNDIYYMKDEQKLKGDKKLYQEIDFIYTYKFNKELKVNLSYSVALPAETLERLQKVENAKTAHWAYLIITYTPKLY